jgi:hypothetical protein
MLFFLSYNAHYLLTRRIILRELGDATRSDQKKNPRKKNPKLLTLQIRTASPISARCIVASIYWRRNNLLSFFLLSFCLYSLSYLCLPISAFPSPSPSPSLSPSSLPSISPRYLYLPLLHRKIKKNIQNGGRTSCCVFAYSWGHRLKVCLPGENRKYIEDDSKIKRQKNIDRQGPRPIPNVCHFPDPPWFSLQTTFKGTVLRDRFRKC